MTHLTPIRTRRNGHTTFRLQPTALHLDDRKPIYHRPRPIYRPSRTWRELAFDVLLTWVVPACALLFLALCFVCIFWLGTAIDRAVRSLNGGL